MKYVKMLTIALIAALLLSSCSYGMLGGEGETSSDIPEDASSAVSDASPSSGAIDSSDALRSEEPAISSEQSNSEGDLPVNASDDWRLLLVNREHPLPKDFQVDLAEISGSTYDFDSRAVGALQDMLEAAKKDGFELSVISAYRKVSKQETLYNNKVAEYVNQGYSEEDAKNEAAKWVAIPGTSEHHTGLATDIVAPNWYQKHGDLDDTFDQTKEFNWLITHCVEYGFVLRYPKDKQDITGITYEPWHYRYVGKENAEYMTSHNLCLEEYTTKQ